jgi:hypothetical protein
MTGHRVIAALDLKPAEDGGLSAPLPAGTRSLLLRFPEGDEQSAAVTLGAVITPRAATELAPGEKVDAQVLFWADEARIHATVGASFDLWYGRVVGCGTVISEDREDREDREDGERS